MGRVDEGLPYYRKALGSARSSTGPIPVAGSMPRSRDGARMLGAVERQAGQAAAARQSFDPGARNYSNRSRLPARMTPPSPGGSG